LPARWDDRGRTPTRVTVEIIHRTPTGALHRGRQERHPLAANGAAPLGIDNAPPDTAGGGSFSASIASVASYIQTRTRGEDRSISPEPNALVLTQSRPFVVRPAIFTGRAPAL